jgi:hypothetical protein
LNHSNPSNNYVHERKNKRRQQQQPPLHISAWRCTSPFCTASPGIQLAAAAVPGLLLIATIQLVTIWPLLAPCLLLPWLLLALPALLLLLPAPVGCSRCCCCCWRDLAADKA